MGSNSPASFAAALLAFALAASACGRGYADLFSAKAEPVRSVGALRPELRIERDADGSAHLRVTEQSFSPFDGTAPAGTIRNRHFGPAPGTNNVIEGAASVLIADVVVRRMKHGLTLQQSGTVSISDYTYSGFAGDGSIFGAAIKLGDNGRPTDGPTYIQRVLADGAQKPDASYKVSNTDFLGVEENSGPVFVRDVTARNFGDAGVDSKSSPLYIMNATLESAHRMVRAWPGVEIYLVNTIINAPPEHSQVWMYDATSTISHFNTLWCVGAVEPSAASPDCRATPEAIESDTTTRSKAAARIVRLSANPLPGINPLFRTAMDEIVVEYSKDNGETWTMLPLLNAGGPGSPPVGDTRYRIALDLDDGAFQFRARYRLNGADTGEMSVPINED